MFPVDFVFPYVNNNDPKWKAEYNKYVNMYATHTEESSGSARYRDYGFLKYLFRGIERNMSWINHVYIIVSDYSQIPGWLNCNNDKLRIVTHKDIIPEQYLPTFNSTTIEMFLKNIPDLSEHFIYSNDDIYFIRNMSKEYFFLNSGIPVYRVIRSSNKNANQYRRICYNEYELVRKKLGKNPLPKEVYMKPDHFAKPMLLSTVKECYNVFEPEILNSISRFREEKNINQYIYILYHWFKYPYQESRHSTKYFNLTELGIPRAAEAVARLLYQEICLNDNANSRPDKAYEALNPLLTKLFPVKSSFEI